MNISPINNSISPIVSRELNRVDSVSSNKVEDKTFSNMLNDAISEVNDTQVEGYKAMEGIATGNVKNLQEAVQRIEEAELSLKLALEVKNKAIAAFKQIGQMQV